MAFRSTSVTVSKLSIASYGECIAIAGILYGMPGQSGEVSARLLTSSTSKLKL